MPGFLTELDIFVFPTWAKWRMEGCPVALLEAMSCGSRASPPTSPARAI